MDTVKNARERLEKIAEERTGWARAKGAAEGKLSREQAAIRSAAAQREVAIEKLASADEDAAKRLHRQIDEFDAKIKNGERVAEALQRDVKRGEQQLNGLEVEAGECQRVIQQDENDKAFTRWQVRIREEFASVSESLASGRLGLAEVNRLALFGEHKFGLRAGTLLAQMFDEFRITEANPNQHGFQDARPIYQDVTVHLRPMVRG